MTKIEAIKAYFGRTKPVENKELLALRRADKESFDELAIACAKELGKEITNQ